MIHNIKLKMKNTHGASMILVMSLLLFCIMVSSVIIAAASSGASRSLRRTQQQRAYLAVSSAADLLVEELEDVKPFIGRKLDKEYGCRYCTVSAGTKNGKQLYELDSALIPNHSNAAYKILIDPAHDPLGTEYVVVALDGTADAFDKLVNRAATFVQKQNATYEEEFSIYLEEPSSSSKDERLPEVTCKLEMDTEYNLTISVKAEDSDYMVEITSAATVKKNNPLFTSAEDVFSCQHTIYYKELVNGSFQDKEAVLEIAGDVTTTTTTVNWNQPKITKGGA